MEDIKKVEEQKEVKNNQPKKIKVNNNSIVILRHRSLALAVDIKELEDKYSDKFGCKVIILESNIDYVDKING